MTAAEPQVWYASIEEIRNYDGLFPEGAEPGFYRQTFPGYDIAGPYPTEEEALQALRAALPEEPILPVETDGGTVYLCACENRQDDLFKVDTAGRLVCLRCYRSIPWVTP